jgi:hypothetical protein
MAPRPQRNRLTQALGAVMTFVEQPLDHKVTEDMIKIFLKTVDSVAEDTVSSGRRTSWA